MMDEDEKMTRVSFWARESDMRIIRKTKRITGSVSSAIRGLIQVGGKARVYLDKNIISKMED